MQGESGDAGIIYHFQAFVKQSIALPAEDASGVGHQLRLIGDGLLGVRLADDAIIIATLPCLQCQPLYSGFSV